MGEAALDLVSLHNIILSSTEGGNSVSPVEAAPGGIEQLFIYLDPRFKYRD